MRIDTASLLAAPPVPAPGGEAAAARSFEAMAIERLLEPATRPLFGEGLLDGGAAGRTFRQMFLSEVARLAAERGGFGLARTLAPALEAAGPGAGA